MWFEQITDKLDKTFLLLRVLLASYHIEGNFGGWKHWRIWQITYHKFARVSSAKIPCLILNNIINVQIYQSLICHQMCFCS